MKVERLERVAINVRNLDEAIRLFSDLLGMTFDMVPKEPILNITEHADRTAEEKLGTMKVAISPQGIELVEMIPAPEKEGLRSFHLKVANLEEAKAEMKSKGIRQTTDVIVGGMKEAIFHPDDLHGVRLVLVEYDAPNAIVAMQQD